MKKFLTFVLVLAMVLSVSSVAMAAEIEATNADFQTKLSSASAGDTIKLIEDITITGSEPLEVNGINIDGNGKTITINSGSMVNFTNSNLTGVTTDGAGIIGFGGTVNFYGTNSITTGEIQGTPFDLVVNQNATLLITRFVLGYNRNITVYGNISDATSLTAADVASMTPSLRFNDPSGVSVGGSSGQTGNLTVKDAYVELGSSSWKNAQGTYKWKFENSYVSATSFTKVSLPGSSSASWDVTFDDSILAAKNYIKVPESASYNFTNGSVATTGSLRVDGELNIDATSSVSTTAQQNNIVGAVDEHGGINGTVNVAGKLNIDSNAKTQLEVLGGSLNVMAGGEVNLGKNELTLDSSSEMTSAGDIKTNAESNGITVADGAKVEITGGSYTDPDFVADLDKYIPEGGKVENGTVYTPVAKIGTTPYYTLQEALKALTDGDTLTLLDDVTITEDWDCRNYGSDADYATITESGVTIDGNGHTLKFTGKISDGLNHLAVFRFEAAVTVKNLTIDMSKAQSVFQNRFSAISTKANLTVDNCTFIGSTSATNATAIIFGETNVEPADIGDTVISITRSAFKDWGRGVSDNKNGTDVKSVAISGNEFNNADVIVSASESAEFNGNTVNNSEVKITSYTNENGPDIVDSDNTIDGKEAVVDENGNLVPAPSAPPSSEPTTKPSTGSGISVKYNGGNSFSTSNPAVPTGVEIDGVPVTFNGTGSNFTVGCISSDAKWVTVRWNSTSVTTNFTPDGLVECTTVSIPKTGDMSIWAAVAAFLGF